MNRAYSLLTVKAIDEEKRIITGIATTPTPDRIGDIVEPEGAEFQLPIPLLWQHNSREPIGFVTDAKVTADGITVTAQIESSDEPGQLKDLLDFAWQAIKKKLVRGLSIGFKEIEYARIENTYSYRYLKWLWLELSAVTIPANGEATIETIKSIDAPLLAASGRAQRASSSPGATGTRKSVSIRPKEAKTMKKSIAEQISAFEAARKEKSARMEEIQSAAADEGRTKDQAEREEFETLRDEIKAIDDELKDLRDMEAAALASAKAVEATHVRTAEGAAQVRSGIQVKTQPKLAPGIGLARFVKCLGMAKGNPMHALELAKSRYGESSAIVGVFKAAVEAGTTLSGSWAEALVGDESTIFGDFAEFLRPQTIIGKFGNNGIPGLRPAPFRTRLITQTGGGQGYWVGQGKPKPLTALDFAGTTLEPNKVANIAVVSKEILMSSSPSAEPIIRDSLAAALRERMDTDFIDPTKNVSANVSPASITYGISLPNSSGNDADAIRADVKTMMQAFIDANNPPTSGVWIMSSGTALALSLMTNAMGQPEFPGITLNGGIFAGLPVITSEYVAAVSAGSYVYLVNASDIYLADEGGLTVDMSTEASLEMLDSGLSQDATAGTGASLVSMFQTNSVAFLAERMINWSKRRASAVSGIDTVNWGSASS